MSSTPCRDDVCEILATLCRGCGSTILTGGEIEAGLNWRRRFLLDDRDGWSALVLRAQCRASGESIRARYRALGWTHHRFETAWRRAADTIAAGLAEERHNIAMVDANMAAGRRLMSSGKIPQAQSAIDPYFRRP